MEKETIKEQLEAGDLIAPAVDVFETETDFVMLLNMPGVGKDGVEVKLADGQLSIFGKVMQNKPEESRSLLKEIDRGHYYRVFRVSDSVDVEKIAAKMENGLLELTLPKHERIKPRDIPIEID